MAKVLRKAVPKNAGQRLIPSVIDELAQTEPDRIIYEYAIGTKVEDGMVKVNMAAYANAINRVSWWLEKQLGRCTSFKPLGYIGPGDLRYFMLAVAAIKVGYIMLFPSPKNSLDGHLAVLKAAKCEIWLLHSEDENYDDILASHPMKTVTIPSLKDLLCERKVAVYPYTKSFTEARNDPCWVLHTSGSTGLPKPIFRNIQSTCSTEAHRLAGLVDGRPLLVDKLTGSRVYMTFPLFHSAGLSNGLYWPLFYDQTLILGPQGPVTIDVITDMLENADVEAIVTAPSTVEDLAQSERCLMALPKMKAVAWGGGPLSGHTGDLISSLTKLILIMGTTEAGWLTCVDTDREDWNYVHFHPLSGLQLRPHPSGLFELWAIRRPECEKFQAVFNTFPDLDEYCFKDLYSPHPIKKGLFHYEGRTDNIIVLSNGEKFNPLRMEQVIECHPLVRSVIVAGQARFQTSAIIELVDSALTMDCMSIILTKLWPAIDAANQEAPRHAKLHRGYVMLASRDKPFLRAGKGTVQRSLTLVAYSAELDMLYSRGESTSDMPPLDATNLDTIRNGIRNYTVKITDIQTLGDEDDMFIFGVDSLQVLMLLRYLRVSLEKSSDIPSRLSTAVIYSNPTISSLAVAIHHIFDSDNVYKQDSSLKGMTKMLQKYLSHLPKSALKANPSNRGAVVILTGSTGSLGSYLLDALFHHPAVCTIYCLNRSSKALSRQVQTNTIRGLSTSWKTKIVHFVTVDLSKSRFSLPIAEYDQLLQNATHIIHNQWQVDFNLSLSSFEPHVQGVTNLVEFSAAAKYRVPIIFASSVGVFGNTKAGNESILGEMHFDKLLSATMGYGQSKLVAEHLLAEASKISGVPSIVCRLGQIAGPVGLGHEKGKWNETEWVHTIIAVSASIGLLPTSLGSSDRLDWIPVNYLAGIILELARFDMPVEPNQLISFFHVLNPLKSSWTDLLPAIQSFVPFTTAQVVSWEEWLNTLIAAINGKSNEAIMSGAKLLPFFESLGANQEILELDTKCAQEHSPSLRKLQPVGGEWMDLWMRQWGYKVANQPSP